MNDQIQADCYSYAGRSSEGLASDLKQWVFAYDEQISFIAGSFSERWFHKRFDASLWASWQDSRPYLRRPVVIAMLGAPTPDALSFQNPANRLALLPADQLNWVMRARALYASALALRRCVDGGLIDRIAAAMGPEGLHVIHEIAAQATAALTEDLSLFSKNTPEAWSRNGFSRFKADHAFDDPFLTGMIDVLVAPEQGGVETQGIHGTEQSAEFIHLIADLYPDTSWLFG